MSELVEDCRLRSTCGPCRGELAWWPKRERREGCAPAAGDARALVDVRALLDDCLAGVLLRDLLGAVAAGEDGLTAGELIRSVRRGAGLDAADAGERGACACALRELPFAGAALPFAGACFDEPGLPPTGVAGCHPFPDQRESPSLVCPDVVASELLFVADAVIATPSIRSASCPR